MTAAGKRDIYQEVTTTIVKAIEEGTPAFKMPWRTSGEFPISPINAVSRKPYRGINTVILWATAQEKNYTSGIWATYKQWAEMGAQVRKGERSTHIVFWKFFSAEEEAGESESAKKKTIPMARDYAVFNVAQVDGYTPPAEEARPLEERQPEIDEIFRALGVEVHPGGNRAYYQPATDTIHMPPFSAFGNPFAFYSVLSHETTHWSGAAHRLKRDLSGRFGSESYAMEELVAELGAAFLATELKLPTDPRTDNAPYIATWLSVLKNDKRAIFTMAAKAQEAVDWMLKREKSEDGA